VTDNAATVPVRFSGIVPALFKEGSGVVADGRFDAAACSSPTQILAKHDERYMPPQVAGAMHKSASLETGRNGQEVIAEAGLAALWLGRRLCALQLCSRSP
jgi:cytochrome c-type biogenesis protein CcmE